MSANDSTSLPKRQQQKQQQQERKTHEKLKRKYK